MPASSGGLVSLPKDTLTCELEELEIELLSVQLVGDLLHLLIHIHHLMLSPVLPLISC